MRIGELVEKLVARAEAPIRAEVDPARLRKVDVPLYVGSAERFRVAVGFEPEISLEQTLDDVLAGARSAVAG